MKKIFLIFLILFLFGCFLDKAEKTLLNCADSSYSENLVNNFNRRFYIDNISLSMLKGTFTPTDILSQKIIPAISWSYAHYCGGDAHTKTINHTTTRSQNSIAMYSTKLLALQGLRGAMVADFAEQLRRVDVQIESEMNADIVAALKAAK